MFHSFKVLLSLALLGSVHLSSWAQAEWPKAKPVTLLVAFAVNPSLYVDGAPENGRQS